MRCVLCLTLALMAVAAVTTRSLSADEEALSYKRFDASVIVEVQHHQRGARLGVGAPLEHVDRKAGAPPEPKALLQIDELIEMVKTHVDPASWENIDGAEMSARGRWLLVRNRPAVVKQVGEFLYRLTLEAQRRMLFSLEVTKGTSKSFPKLSEGASVAASGSGEVPLGIERILTRTSRVHFVSDYEVEIAQGSNISNPIVTGTDEGLLASVVARPSVDGQHLVVEALVQTAKYGTARRMSLGVDEEYLPRPPRSDTPSTNGTLELPIYEHTQAHFTAVVPVAQNTFTLPVAVRGRMVLLRLNTRGVGDQGHPRFIDVGALAQRPMPVVFGKTMDPDMPKWFAPRVRFIDEDEVNACFGDAETIVEEFLSRCDRDYWEERGSIGVQGASLLTVRADDKHLGNVRTFLQDLERQAVRPVVVNIQVWSMPSGVAEDSTVKVFSHEGGHLVAAGTLPTLLGRRASLMAGSTANYLADYDVEVAQEARIADPNIGQSFDGLVVNMLPSLSPDQRTVNLSLQMLLAKRTLSDRPFASGTKYLGPIDDLRQDRSVIDTNLQIPLGNVRLVDMGVDPENKDRRLTAEIRVDLGSVVRAR